MNNDPTKPVAYDAEGRPLYAAPQVPTTSSHVTNAATNHEGGQNYDPGLRSQYSNEPHVVHANRPVEPQNKQLSDAVQKRCEESKATYPELNLSEGEFVILDIKRHPIGLFLPIFATTIALLAIVFMLIIYPSAESATTMGIPSFGAILIPALLFMLLVGLGGFIAVWVYLQNQFFLTNESVIQEIQHSLFSRHEQTVSLGSIEDASFKHAGILQSIFNYGTIRLSTEGEETTYRFAYVADPRKQVAILNNAIEDFKNGRPVDLFEN